MHSLPYTGNSILDFNHACARHERWRHGDEEPIAVPVCVPSGKRKLVFLRFGMHAEASRESCTLQTNARTSRLVLPAGEFVRAMPNMAAAVSLRLGKIWHVLKPLSLIFRGLCFL